MSLAENASKAGFKQEQCQDIQLSGGAVLSQETLPLEFNAWKSTEVSHRSAFLLPLRCVTADAAPGVGTEVFSYRSGVQTLTRPHRAKIKGSAGPRSFLQAVGENLFPGPFQFHMC